jgi:NADPH:quinone reductase-like Zn-dependent oxidoreductase
VLLRVRAAGVDRGTWHLMTGRPLVMRGLGFGLRGPRTAVPGVDVSGTVVALGAGVDGLAVGDDVFGTCRGSFAEYATARPDRLAPLPADLGFEEAAAIPVSATTALQAVRDQGRVGPGQQVLVVGASGGIGTYAVQIAKALGAEVTGMCSGGKAELVTALGADHVLDYARDGVADGGPQFDVIVDIAGNRRLAELRGALTRRGTLVIVGGEDGGRWLGGIERNLRAQLLSPFVGQRLTAFISRQRRADLLVLRDLVESGAVTPIVDRSYTLAEAAAAVRHVADGQARGKVVVTC